MRLFFLTAALLAVALMSRASTGDSLLTRLDAVLADRADIALRKEARIDSLKTLLGATAGSEDRLALLGRIYDEYLTFNFDSAMACVSHAESLARAVGDPDALAAFRIREALSLATSGHFSQAVAILDSMDGRSLPPELRAEYYSACEWTYGVWAEYADNRIFSPHYKEKSVAYLDSLIAVMLPGTPEYDYRMAEKALRKGDYAAAEKLYLKALAVTPENTRLYAQMAYALALVYESTGRDGLYRDWLVRAAISDQVTPLKENLALQQLAIYLKNHSGDLARANRYLRYSLDDAIFYGNRLRMLEIAGKIPDITIEYQDTVARQNRRLVVSLIVIALLAAGMGVAVWQLMRQVRKRRRAMEAKARLADELADLNRRLVDTNRSREQYTSLFVDLCGAYIDKLNRFPTVLRTKVHQLSDLNAVADRYVRPSEADIREMFFNFDTAFLKLYPDFIEQFNSLLQPEKRIYPKDKELLNTDLRIYSLVRMGVTDSNRIASLLFYSPQTIFNHRTAVRNRAIDRAGFERRVMEICQLR